MSEEQTKIETPKQEVKEEVKPQDSEKDSSDGVKPENLTPIDRANAILERISEKEKLLDDRFAELDKRERQIANRMLGGTAEVGSTSKPSTPRDKGRELAKEFVDGFKYY